MRSASDMAHATQVAPLPSSWGCSAAASPPAEPAGTGRPVLVQREGQRAPVRGDDQVRFHGQPTPLIPGRPYPPPAGPLRRATMAAVPDDPGPASAPPALRSPPTPSRGPPAAPAVAAAMAGRRPAGRMGLRPVPALGRRGGLRRGPGRGAARRGRLVPGAWHRTPGDRARWGRPWSPGGGWPTAWPWWSRPPPRGCPWPGGPRATTRSRATTRGTGELGGGGRGRRRPAGARGRGRLGHHRRGPRARSRPSRRAGGLGGHRGGRGL